MKLIADQYVESLGYSPTTVISLLFSEMTLSR